VGIEPFSEGERYFMAFVRVKEEEGGLVEGREGGREDKYKFGRYRERKGGSEGGS